MQRSCISFCRAAGRKRGDGMSDVIKDVLMGKLFGGSGTSSGGGSGGGGGVQMATGKYVVAEDTEITHPNYIEIAHGLGVLPDLILFEDAAMYPMTGFSDAFISMELRRMVNGDSNIFIKKAIYSTKSATGTVTRTTTYIPTESVFFVGNLGSTTAATLRASTEYIWYAFKWEE